jgi:diguanylate cyclase (GGDEF)-like protein
MTTAYITLVIVIVGVLSAAFISSYYYKIRTQKFMQTFIDSQPGMVLIMNLNTTVMINKATLDFLGFKSLKSFLSSCADISDFFLREKGCITKYDNGKNWLKHISEINKKETKVKLCSKSDDLNYHFHIRVSKLIGTMNYIVIFEDISKIEREKSEIQKSADFDALTKIYNRVKINELFVYLFFNAKKYNQHLSIILFDIDHFKKINDTYGHNVGDSVLVELTGLVKHLLRSKDTFARWGGEEFIIILNDSTLEQAAQLSSRLCKEIEKYPFNHVDGITCSFGVTELDQGDTEKLLLERVDQALYAAKDNGRNQVSKK